MLRLLAGLSLLLIASTSSAQGLVWSLPPDKAWVQYEGEYQQVLFDPTGNQKPTIEDARTDYDCDGRNVDFADVTCWRRKLWIRSVGTKKAMFQGAEVDCRWIEFEFVHGIVPEGELDIDPGPVGTRILKVLVPESAVRGETEDERGIPVAFLPIVEAYQQVGQGQPQPVTGKVLQLYPNFTLLGNYLTLEPDGSAVDPGLAVDAGALEAVRGEVIVESKTDRSTNTGTLWKSEGVPFGVAAWKVTIVREFKDATQARTDFVPRSRIVSEMKLTKTGLDATSKIAAGAAAPPAPVVPPAMP